MADRIGALGGEIAWRSAPGVGTTVIGRTPVPHTAAAMPPARPVGLPPRPHGAVGAVPRPGF
jgi:hypothetical protein